MYDWLHVWLPYMGQVRYADCLCKVSRPGFKRHTLKNLIIEEKSGRLEIKGSLHKYFFDNNLQTMTAHDFKLAVEQVSKVLEVELVEAKIAAFEFGANLQVSQPPRVYLDRIGRLHGMSQRRYWKGYQIETIYAGETRSGLQLKFYDKRAELKHKCLGDWRGLAPVIRYEIRVSGKWLEKLGLRGQTLEGLMSTKTINRLAELWKRKFDQIRLAPQPFSLSLSGVNGPKELWDRMALQGVLMTPILDLERELMACVERKELSQVQVQAFRKKLKAQFLVEPYSTLEDELATKVQKQSFV